MSIRIYVGTVSKCKNSTYQPTLSTFFDCDLKAPTSMDEPTFLISAASFPYNYIIWDTNYYFVTNRVSVRNNQWEVSAKLDVLATAKTEILASTQYVCYSSMSGGTWLPDTRIALLKETNTSRSSASLSAILNSSGFYVLAATGIDGCRTYACNKSHLTQLLKNINSWVVNTVNGVINPGGYQFNTPEQAIESLSSILCNTDFYGNAYQQAPQCIRSCIWVPFAISPFLDGAPAAFYLGRFDCELSPLPYYCSAEPATGAVSVSIPWHYSDWRRGICEDVYLYLPLVGTIQLSATSLTHVSSLTINYSATATDGVMSYEVVAGSDRIGVYGGQCASNYPIGIVQQASAGEIAQALISGVEKTVAAGMVGSVAAIPAAAVGSGFELLNTTYQIQNTANTTHHTTIGGVGGGAGAGLSFDVQCFTVAHPTVISPSDMQATMGVPTMQPVTLSSLSGYCQCANAHVEAPLDGPELDAIDAYLNSGFYIE